ncbi:hypothetical protein Vretimale_16506 [Volvox reticuliferus]|uniref:Uncharacterized protein n=1 Tax=Volvox reticuliferus TaxID=1737510 RepID=A0A8J4GT15_9CHLO|nr:hypothetical protein Vretifemale_8639 [Volvox reticuliferus]GIM13343.1 hypothetical protein Vretimale_16506 [Volvox reticuliferus]
MSGASSPFPLHFPVRRTSFLLTLRGISLAFAPPQKDGVCTHCVSTQLAEPERLVSAAVHSVDERLMTVIWFHHRLRAQFSVSCVLGKGIGSLRLWTWWVAGCIGGTLLLIHSIEAGLRLLTG